MAERLDIEIVVRGLARSRSHAAQLIEQSRILVGGRLATKPAQKVEPTTEISCTPGPDFVSRAGQKLDQALTTFGIQVPELVMDVGASTGGFTQVLLERGAEKVLAVDVGHGQLAEELRANPKVLNLEGQNIRELTPQILDSLVQLESSIGLVVADLSFISLTLVLEPITRLAPEADQVLLIKPQFEVGKHSLNASGIVTDWRERKRAIDQVVEEVYRLRYSVRGLIQSSLLGTHGNTEYLLWITPKPAENREQWDVQINRLAKKVG